MKKRMFILIISLIILGGCDMNNQSKFNDSNNVENTEKESQFGENVNDLKNVSIELNKDVFKSKNDHFEITVINDSEEEVSYGAEYILEFKKGNTWYEVETENEPGFVLILMTLPPKSEDTDRINLDFYEPLEKGHYRIVRNIGEKPMTAEFKVKD